MDSDIELNRFIYKLINVNKKEYTFELDPIILENLDQKNVKIISVQTKRF